MGGLAQRRELAARDVSRPFASASLIITPIPASCATASASAGRALEQVPGRLNGVYATDLNGAQDRRGLLGAGHADAHRDALSTQRVELATDLGDRRARRSTASPNGSGTASDTSPSCSRVSRELASKRVGAEVLDLGRVGVDLPVGGVGVSPFGADRDRAGLQRSRSQPLAEELLGPAVGAGGVEVAHAPPRTPRRAPRACGRAAPAPSAPRSPRRGRGSGSPDGPAPRARGRSGWC